MKEPTPNNTTPNTSPGWPPPPPPMQAPSSPRPRRRKLASSQLSHEQINQLAATDLNILEPHEKSDSLTIVRANQKLLKGMTYVARSA